MALPLMAAGAAAQAVGGVIKTVGSLFGGGKRRREQRAAAAEMAQYKQKYEQLDTSNPYENLTVNTQAADFAAQQNSQNAANIMSGLAGAAGGGGIAALAQSMANSQAQQAQQASASIAQQESQNQQLAAQGEFKRQSMIAAGEQVSQQREMDKTGTLLGMAQQRKAAADEARAAAKADLLGGIGDIAGAGIAAGAANAGPLAGVMKNLNMQVES
jgi:hypothetical protein